MKTPRLQVAAQSDVLWLIKDHQDNTLGQISFQAPWFTIHLAPESQGLGVASEAASFWIKKNSHATIKAQIPVDQKTQAFLERLGFQTNLDDMVWTQRPFIDQYHRLNQSLGIDTSSTDAPRCWSACRLIDVGPDVFDRPAKMDPQAATAWHNMQNHAAESGVVLQLVSAYRSPKYQAGLIQKKLDRGQCLSEILKINTPPGHSEHHTGRALDITTPGFDALETEFEESEAFAWLKAHGHEHGFTLSYPRGNSHGISYEPWHWCFTTNGL